MKFSCLIFLLSTCMASAAFAQWTPPVQITQDVPFIDSRVATSDSFIYSVGELPGVTFYFIKSTDNGATWSLPVTPAPADTFYGCDMPDIIYSNGKIHIAWIGYFAHSRETVFHISSTDEGITWSAPHRVFNNDFPLLKYPRLAVKGDSLFLSCRIASLTQSYILVFRSFNEGIGWRDSTVAESVAWVTDYPPTILYSLGRIHLVYQVGLDADSAIEIYYRNSTNFGRNWSSRVRLSERDRIDGQFPSANADGQGNIMSAWFDYRFGSMCGVTGDIFTRTSTDNGDSWLPSGRVTFTQSGHESSCLNVGGILYIIWEDHWLYGCSFAKLMYSSSIDWGMGWSNPVLITDSIHIDEAFPALGLTAVEGDSTLHAFISRPDTMGGAGLFYMRSHNFVGVWDNGENPVIPERLSLAAYPNPFNSSTILSVNNAADAEISIFDITGRQIASLHAKQGKAIWDASGFSSGLYFARAIISGQTRTIKLLYLK